MKIVGVLLCAVSVSFVFAQTVGFYEDTSSGQWLYGLIDQSRALEVECSDEQLAVIKREGAADYVCLVDFGYPERPFDQDFATYTQLDLEALPGEFASGGGYPATPESTRFVNTEDGHKATLTFEDGYMATITISPYGNVAIFGDFQ